MPTTIPNVATGDVITEAWGDAVRQAVEELQATPPNHGSRHQPGGADALPTAAAGASAVGDTAATGTSTSLARADHRHAREAFGSPATSAPGAAAADGSASTVSHSDHVHARADGYGTGTNPVSNAANAGASGNISRSDHKHALLGDGAQAISGSSGAVGAGAEVDVTLTWPVTFGSTPSMAFLSSELNAAIPGPTLMIKTISATNIVVRVHNNDVSSRTFTIRALGIK